MALTLFMVMLVMMLMVMFVTMFVLMLTASVFMVMVMFVYHNCTLFIVFWCKGTRKGMQLGCKRKKIEKKQEKSFLMEAVVR